jgi:hypothetical protein
MISKIIKRFQYNDRSFYIDLTISSADGSESIQLNEELIVRGKKYKHLIKSDGILEKSEPILFACKIENKEIEISMQYEGFPLEPILEFLKEIKKVWKKNDLLRLTE